MCINPINIKNAGYKHNSSLARLDKSYREMVTGVKEILVPCGKCIECQKNIATEWAFRVMDELMFHEASVFVTLTYAETIPELYRPDITNFLKRLRQQIAPVKIRYFGCGEYGAKGGRPHFHLIIFGWCPFDLVPFFKTKQGGQVYRSEMLADLWKRGVGENKRGFVTCENVTFDTAKYCALYMQKFQDLPDNFVKPFRLMSKKPGIGYRGINSSSILSTDKIYHLGRYVKTPRYYLKVLERNGVDLSQLKENRLIVGTMCDRDISTLNLMQSRENDFIGKFEHTLTKRELCLFNFNQNFNYQNLIIDKTPIVLYDNTILI